MIRQRPLTVATNMENEHGSTQADRPSGPAGRQPSGTGSGEEGRLVDQRVLGEGPGTSRVAVVGRTRRHSLLGGVVSALANPRKVKENYLRITAEQKGQAVAQARRIKCAVDIHEVAIRLKRGRPEEIAGAGIRMKDGIPMVFYTDGSLRHATGFKPGKAARKALKRLRRQQHG